MPRLLIIAILAAGSTLSLPTNAQRGGMHGGMGGGRGAVGHGPVAGPRGAPAMPGGRFAGAPSAPRFGAHNGRFIGGGVGANNGRFGGNNHTVFVNGRGHRCFGGFDCRNRFFFNNGFGFGFPGFGLGFPYYGYIPGFYPSDYFQEPQAQQPVVASNGNEGNTQLAVEIQRLSDEISFMRQEQTRQAQARQPGDPQSAHSAQLTVFVFRDGQGITTENYAIAGQTLWVFNERVAKKYPMSELDRATTERVNAENGVEIRLPAPAPEPAP
jgi:hypothetical protein